MVSGIAEGSVTNYFGVTLKLVLFKNKQKKNNNKKVNYQHIYWVPPVYKVLLDTLGDIVEDKLCSSNWPWLRVFLGLLSFTLVLGRCGGLWLANLFHSLHLINLFLGLSTLMHLLSLPRIPYKSMTGILTDSISSVSRRSLWKSPRKTMKIGCKDMNAQI